MAVVAVATAAAAAVVAAVTVAMHALSSRVPFVTP